MNHCKIKRKMQQNLRKAFTRKMYLPTINKNFAKLSFRSKFRQIVLIGQFACSCYTINLMALRKIGNCLGTFRQYVQECDLFAPNILLRFKNDTQFKTLTSALVSISLVVFFIIVFSNRFIMTIKKTDVVLQTAFIEQMDPTLYTINTSNFMFVIGVKYLLTKLEGMNLNPSDLANQTRYFNVGANHLSFVDGVKTQVPIPLQACTFQQWHSFGDQFASRFNTLNLSQWLCPKNNEVIELQGKFSSSTFKLIKIYANKCSGSGCATDAQIDAFLQSKKNFKLIYYFTKTVVNPEQRVPISMTLEDSIYNQFSLAFGSTTNLFMESFSIQTDESLWPSQNIQTINGVTTANTPEMRYYSINGSDTEYSTIFVRKSPRSRTINRSYQKYDDFLSYIGGLFGLITIFLGVPLYYYNLCCYELTLATNMFTYKKMDEQGSMMHNSGSSNGQSKALQRKSTFVRKKEQQQQLMHSVSRFNFLRFLGFLPYYMVKYLGCAEKFTCDVFQPYYEAITEIRKQIDIGKILQRFTYIDRMAKSLLDQDQRNLLHVYSKENICQINQDRMNYKIQSHALRLKRDEHPSPLPKNLIQRLTKLQKTLDPVQKQKRKGILIKLTTSYKHLTERNDEISRRIIENIDPQLIKMINQALKNEILSPQAVQDIADINLQIKSEVGQDRLRRMQRANSYNDKVIHYQIELSNQNINSEQALGAPKDLTLKKAHSYDQHQFQP